MSSAPQPAIAVILLARLQAAGCVRGQFETEKPAGPYSLTGELADGTAIPLSGNADATHLARLVSDFFNTNYSTDHARLLIGLDVARGRTVYSLLTAAQQQAREQQQKQSLKTGAHVQPRHRAPFGAALAAQVAEGLSHGQQLMPYHRDYCGMGLECHNHHYCYGEVWDGRYLEPQLIFSCAEDFVAWLASQSNKSLARLEEANPWYWHNQTITRQRLLEFVQPNATIAPA